MSYQTHLKIKISTGARYVYLCTAAEILPFSNQYILPLSNHFIINHKNSTVLIAYKATGFGFIYRSNKDI